MALRCRPLARQGAASRLGHHRRDVAAGVSCQPRDAPAGPGRSCGVGGRCWIEAVGWPRRRGKAGRTGRRCSQPRSVWAERTSRAGRSPIDQRRRSKAAREDLGRRSGSMARGIRARGWRTVPTHTRYAGWQWRRSRGRRGIRRQIGGWAHRRCWEISSTTRIAAGCWCQSAWDGCWAQRPAHGLDER